MTHEPDPDRCGAGRCVAPLALVANGVPLCWAHWSECCDADQPTSVWLARKARREWRPAIEPTAQAAKDTARRLAKARRQRVPELPVDDASVRSKPGRKIATRRPVR